MSIGDDLQRLREQAVSQLDAAHDSAALAEWKGRYLGKQGELARLSRGLGALAPAERPAAESTADSTGR